MNDVLKLERCARVSATAPLLISCIPLVWNAPAVVRGEIFRLDDYSSAIELGESIAGKVFIVGIALVSEDADCKCLAQCVG